MIRRRASPDGLPFRVYEYRGARTYSIGHKAADGKWSFRLKCAVTDEAGIRALKLEAIDRWRKISAGAPSDDSFAALCDAWFKRQESLPPGTSGKRADSTLAENRRELDMLKAALGHIPSAELEKAHGYAYLDACLIARDKEGNLRPRPEKGNKEIALARVVCEWGIRIGKLKTNPFDGIEKLVTDKAARLVTQQELDLAVEVGRRMGGPQHIVAMALKTAWLCLRRSVEVRALTRDQITDAGIVWQAAKRQRGALHGQQAREWSAELRATMDEALGIKRNKLAGAWYVFGNLDGQRYTKGGWKATLAKLMRECTTEAAKRKLAFQAFSLQDCRPKGVSDKMERGDDDVIDATLHTSERMVRQVYDRRHVRVAKPAR